MSPQQIYAMHEPLAMTLLALTALFAVIESFRRRR